VESIVTYYSLVIYSMRSTTLLNKYFSAINAAFDDDVSKEVILLHPIFIHLREHSSANSTCPFANRTRITTSSWAAS
jgi:hypothetical protein